MTQLHIWRSQISDISPLSSLTNLTRLNLGGNQISDISTLSSLTKLAEMEHERWMKQKLDNNWQYARMTDKVKKLHKDLVPWDKLPEKERGKDRILVRGIPRILAKAGYTVVKLS
ncbi:RyR domain-containing protein [Chloroflexota bacterium]